MAFTDLKKQASFFLRGKVNEVRLALTSASRIELLTEDATNGDPWGPETKTMSMIAKALFERDEYERIVQVLQQRLSSCEKTSWRQLYKTLSVLEYLLMHGPYSLRDEFRANDSHLEDICELKFVDEQGIDKSFTIREKAERILELIIDANHWKAARSHAQKNSVDISGFGNMAPSTGIEYDRENILARKVLSLQESHAEDAVHSKFADVLKQFNRSISCPTANHATVPDDEKSALLNRNSDALQEGKLE